jgi:Ras family protein A
MPQPSGEDLPPYQLPRLLDADQPFAFNMKIRQQTHRFHFYDTSSPDHYTTIKPHMIILCFDISERNSLDSLAKNWHYQVQTHFNYDETLPVMVLGLKRDLRREWTREQAAIARGPTLMPQEGLIIAQQMRCDLYAECSALTGELFKETVEDIAKTVMGTYTEGGGKSAGFECSIM